MLGFYRTLRFNARPGGAASGPAPGCPTPSPGLFILNG